MCTVGGKPPVALTSKEKLKQAVKDYGATVIIFHISISVISLGACYLLVSRYVVFINYYGYGIFFVLYLFLSVVSSFTYYFILFTSK